MSDTLVKRASLHESTVQQAEKLVGIYDSTKSHTQSRKVTNMRTVKVDPRVWRIAMKLAKKKVNRILVISSTEVIVLNHSGQYKDA